MRLVPCSRPSGPLDPAPLTALCGAPDVAPAGSAVAYEAFWAGDDGYYLRRTEAGVASWLAVRAEAREESGPPGRRSGAHTAVGQTPAAPREGGRLRVLLLGRSHGPRPPRVPMHLCVRRVRPAS